MVEATTDNAKLRNWGQWSIACWIKSSLGAFSGEEWCCVTVITWDEKKIQQISLLQHLPMYVSHFVQKWKADDGS